MGMFDRFIKTEERTLEDPNAPVSAAANINANAVNKFFINLTRQSKFDK